MNETVAAWGRVDVCVLNAGIWRPESLAIGPNVPPDSNRLAATVERLVFLGETRQVHLRGPGDWPIIALTLQSQSQSLREGQSLTLSVPPEQVVVLLGKYAVTQG